MNDGRTIDLIWRKILASLGCDGLRHGFLQTPNPIRIRVLQQQQKKKKKKKL